jgi:glycerol-3-phosphate dehydrogenase
VINATGVFVDAIRRNDDPTAHDVVAPSQGIHLVLPKIFLPGDTALMIPKTADGRVLFCVPWHERVIVGTTDTPVRSLETEPRALPEERAFLMEHAAKYLNHAPGEDDVLSIYAGLRPLVKSGKNTRSSSLSRDHTILVSPSGLLTVTGGKWTTYRKIGEEVVNRAEKIAGLKSRACVSENLRIHGWTENPTGVYGADTEAVRDIGHPEPLHPRLPYTRGEVLWHVRAEMARSVEGVLARRTRALLLDAVASSEAAENTARLMAPELGKDEAWIQQQTQAYQTLARGYTFKDPASQSLPAG